MAAAYDPPDEAAASIARFRTQQRISFRVDPGADPDLGDRLTWPRRRSATRRCSSSSGRQEVVELLGPRRAARLHGRHGGRPLPAVGPPAGPGRVRVERHDRHRRADEGRRRARASPARRSGCTRRSSPRRRRPWRRCTRAATGWASGSGEALNEHVVAGYWPETPERIARMFEAIEIIRKLFSSRTRTSSTTGKFFKLETTRLWTMPETSRRRSTSRRPGRSPPRRPGSTPTG